jgi:2-oxoisovalerate ferredoxin oxidoreductase beta subunit
MRYTLKALGPKTIISIPACCWAILSGVFPNSALSIPMLNTAFEVTGAAISGIDAALKRLNRDDVTVVGFAGDGGTFDIGIQALSGAIERGHNFIYVCYDNEAYMNTGVQRSGATPIGSWTTTTPVGKTRYWETSPKKNMIDIVVAHKIPYAAIVNIAYPEDFIKKVRKARDIKGPTYIQAYAPCPPGWGADPSKTVELGRLAVNTCVYPLYEVEDGKYIITRKPRKKLPVTEYLQLQNRFRHLDAEGIHEFQATVDAEWSLLLKKAEYTQEL